MRHTFHIAFVSHLGLKRKYCFSVPELAIHAKWQTLLDRQIAATTSANAQPTTRVRRAAEDVALQVLRDAVVPPETTKRSNSISVTTGGTREVDLDGAGGMVQCLTGKELVLLCRQNSLLPGLLELLQAGVGEEDSVAMGSRIAAGSRMGVRV